MQSGYAQLEADMNKAKGIAAEYQSVVEKIENKDKADKAKSDAEVQKRLALDERNE